MVSFTMEDLNRNKKVDNKIVAKLNRIDKPSLKNSNVKKKKKKKKNKPFTSKISAIKTTSNFKTEETKDEIKKSGLKRRLKKKKNPRNKTPKSIKATKSKLDL